MQKHYITTLLTVVFLLFMTTETLAQSTAGPIQIDEFADSTNITAGDNFPQQLERDSSYTIKGSYGNIGAAQTVRLSYDIYKSDWSGLEYSHTWIIADDTTGTIDGEIDFTFTIPSDAPAFNEFPGAFYIIQARVVFDPVEDTFWNIFVEVASDSAANSIEIPQIQGLALYPNPIVDGILKVETPRGLQKSVSVMDLSGREVFYQEMQGNGNLDLNNLVPGAYLVRVREDESASTMKVLIK
ncbi:MAG: T9SS type A sorting domain-containing protein [Bacteroidota bacterium]